MATKRARLTALCRAARSPTRPTTRSASSPRGLSSEPSTRTGRSNPTAATSSSSATPRGASCASSPASSASPTRRASRRRSRSGWAKLPAARASSRRRSELPARTGLRGAARGFDALLLRGELRRGASRAPGRVQIAEYIEAGPASPRRRADAEARHPRALLRRERRHAARRPRPVRLADQQGVGARAAEEFCVGFGFELQAAANEESIVLSLGPQHSFELADVFDYLHPDDGPRGPRPGLLASPLFETRWRWNAQRSLLLERSRGRQEVPAPLQRMRANDLLGRRFPAGPRVPGDASREARSRSRWTTRSSRRRSRTA